MSVAGTTSMPLRNFSLAGLRLTTPRLELRLPSWEELDSLADLTIDGIHEPDVMPFLDPWTDGEPEEVAHNTILRHWRHLGSWTPRRWVLDLTVFHRGVVVGEQTIDSHDFAITREVHTRSWLGRRHQGKGIGTEMRAAALHLAFAGLEAKEAISSAWQDNVASLAISRKLGYRPDGLSRQVSRGALAIEQRLRLTRADWARHRTVPVTIDNLDPCLPMFGLTTAHRQEAVR